MSAAISKAIEVASSLCKISEGLRLRPYLCPAGYPTIGYGTVNKPDGSRVTMQHSPITRDVAESWLLHELRYNYMQKVLEASPALISYPYALGAITDFAYNLGAPRYKASTLRRYINRKDWASARKEILKWNRGGGKVLAGLTSRRIAESRLLPQ